MSGGPAGERRWIPLPAALFVVCDVALAERLMQLESVSAIDGARKAGQEAIDQRVAAARQARGRLVEDALRLIRSGEVVARGWRHDLNAWVGIDPIEFGGAATDLDWESGRLQRGRVEFEDIHLARAALDPVEADAASRPALQPPSRGGDGMAASDGQRRGRGRPSLHEAYRPFALEALRLVESGAEPWPVRAATRVAEAQVADLPGRGNITTKINHILKLAKELQMSRGE